MIKILSIFGTRPEVIKMAPVIRELTKHPDRVQSIVCVTAQHREMLDQTLRLFNITPDYDLNIMQKDQNLVSLTARVLSALDSVLESAAPDWILVQGDTTTVMAASLVAFYHNVRVGHIEAGLRSDNKRAPFPEEINRRITSSIADLHFAPTEKARQALLKENIPDEKIIVTGNTVIDSLLWIRDMNRCRAPILPEGIEESIEGRHMILVTGHRRESFGEGFNQICRAMLEIVESHDDVCIVYPVHMNPNVREPVYRLLGNHKNIFLIEPLTYASFVWLMDKAYLILTDSGGVQEEAPSMGKPVLVMRETTERPEGIEAGTSCLTGTSQSEIVSQTHDLLTNPERYKRMSAAHNPYGDGHAAEMLVARLLKG
jgi:UDP-N-acetylglucosamine 2-epimerase (non-hydrolysing)